MTTRADAFRRAYDTGKTTIVIDGKHPAVKLPEALTAIPTVALTYGMKCPLPTADLKTDAHGIYATLSFARKPFQTFVPWDAVKMVDNDNVEALPVPTVSVVVKGDLRVCLQCGESSEKDWFRVRVKVDRRPGGEVFDTPAMFCRPCKRAYFFRNGKVEWVST